jgi:mannose/cellobiose epimerase-like protein (N-acyl-D-glucosamine 2-epimerase family)
MSEAALKRRAREARSWLFDSCFPLWAEHGLTPAGLFPEKLSLEHDDLPQPDTRVRVQARQTYVFAEAGRLGWRPDMAARLSSAGTAILAGPAIGPGGLAGRRLAADGSGLIDPTPDLYDTAFVLYGLAQALTGGGADTAKPAIDRILSALDEQARDRLHGGYAESLPAPDRRLQNPHMHLLEACLALHAAQPDAGHLDRAQEITELFETRFTAGPGGLLGEVFARDWGPPDPADENLVEPGHQFEWVWLLHQAARASRRPVSEAAARLYDFACRTCDEAGRVPMTVTRAGQPADASRRTWGQTEALKAHLAMLETGGASRAAASACQIFDVMMEEFLTEDGGWIDHFAADGEVLARDMPASTGYHVVLAFSELIHVAGV